DDPARLARLDTVAGGLRIGAAGFQHKHRHSCIQRPGPFAIQGKDVRSPSGRRLHVLLHSKPVVLSRSPCGRFAEKSDFYRTDPKVRSAQTRIPVQFFVSRRYALPAMTTLHPSWKGERKIVIGMLHLPALPGAPLFRGTMDSIREGLLRDADVLAEGGVHGLMMENFGDVPFYPDRVPAHVIAQMTALACEVRRRVDLPLGINVLRNDGRGALAVAHASGASFIRVNVLCGARVTDQGLIQGIAHDLLRERALLGAEQIKIFADVDVKHSVPLAERPLEDEVDDLIERALADAIVV